MKTNIVITSWQGEKPGITVGKTYEMDLHTGHFLDDDGDMRHAPTYGTYTVELPNEPTQN